MQISSLSDLEATRDELLFEVHKMAQEEEGHKADKTVSLLLFCFTDRAHYHRNPYLQSSSHL